MNENITDLRSALAFAIDERMEISIRDENRTRLMDGNPNYILNTCDDTLLKKQVFDITLNGSDMIVHIDINE